MQINYWLEQARRVFENLTDCRKGPNKIYGIEDLAMATYFVFHMQSPSFLAHQEALKKRKDPIMLRHFSILKKSHLIITFVKYDKKI